MASASAPQRDPIGWTVLIALAFLALVWHRLGIPAKIYFDEVHYVPAARKLLDMQAANPEHPLLGKQIIAMAIALLGDKPLAWRIPSALFGVFGLFAFGRMLWWASGRRFATLAGMVLLATSFAWFIQSRIAMLDMFMAAFGMAALWQAAAALHGPPAKARLRLGLAGVLLGLAMGAKWSVAPVAMLPGIAFLAYRFRDHGRRCMIENGTRPLPGIALWEAAIWLGLLPLAIYWLTYLPAFFYPKDAIGPLAFIEHHRTMLELQDSVRKPHPYRTVWYEWIVNARGIWYLYENTDGAQRGVVLIGNPFSMLAGLPALAWCLWVGLWKRRNDALAMAALYGVSLGLWIVTSKPIQFYYHYLLPGTFLMGCLALALDALWNRQDRWRWIAPLSLVAAIGVFAWFYPIVSSAVLDEGKQAYVKWMWLHSWR